MPFKNYIALLHSLGEAPSIRIDFKSDRLEYKIIDDLIMDGYSVYQFIDQEHTYLMESDELIRRGVHYETFKREEKLWFGLSKKEVKDLLIHPGKGFYYPYVYGHYFYLFSKEKISGEVFFNWLNAHFKDHFSAFGDLEFGSFKKNQFLM